MEMRPTKLLIFGNPKGGTPLMLAAPSIAIDLPLKILVWEDDQGKVWVSYNSPEYLAERHGLPAESGAEYRLRGDAGGQRCGVTLECRLMPMPQFTIRLPRWPRRRVFPRQASLRFHRPAETAD